MGTTVEQAGEHLADIVASLRRHLPAVNVELFLVLFLRAAEGHLPLIGQVDLVANHEDSDLAEVDGLIWVWR
jgi:hypothetical protein